MYESVSFNIYKENLENIVFTENQKPGRKNDEQEESQDKPIPKPPPQYWNDPMSYRRSNRESEGTSNIL